MNSTALAALLEHLPILPEVLLLAGACTLLLVDLRAAGAQRIVSYRLAQAVLLGCAAAAGYVLWSGGAGAHYQLFNKLFVGDLLSNVLTLAACLAAWIALVYSRRYMQDRGLFTGEFMALLLFALLGMMVMMGAGSFLTVYLGLELLSLCLYAMVALNRDSAVSTEAAMKYFVLGALASGMLLYGMSMIYGATGSLVLGEIAQGMALLPAGGAERGFIVLGLVFVVAGVAFKLGVVPFHMWIPDVYQGAPTAITLVIGSAPKLAAFAMAMRLLAGGLLGLAADWQHMLVVLALLSMALGNFAAIAQTNLKRMLAYSTIAHMGFMLLGLLSGVAEGETANAEEAWGAAMFYTLVYVLMTLGAFGTVLLLSRRGFEADRLEDIKGLNRRSPWFAFVMLVLMLSLAGVPPTAGFYAKLAVLSAAVGAGQVGIAVFAVLMSLVGAFFYLRIVKLMYFDEPKDQTPLEGERDMKLLLSANGIAVLLIGILPQPLMALCAASIRALQL